MVEEEFHIGVVFVRLTCRSCGVDYMIPKALHEGRKRDKEYWFCPNGHQWHYAENEEDRLRRERDRLVQDAAYKDDRIKSLAEQRDHAERRVAAARGQVTKMKKRVSAGVCPCCNRTFVDLARHMVGQHPGFVAEPTADEHVH